MKKLVYQGLVTVFLFGSIFFAVRSVNWVDILNIEDNHVDLESELGDLFLKTFIYSHEEINTSKVIDPLEKLLGDICESNDIDMSTIHLHVVESNEVNAFALPGGHILIYSGLIEECENVEEFAGVLSHELAHIQNKHVMKKLIKEVGLGILVGMTTGDQGSDIIQNAVKELSSSAFDRVLEKEADLTAVDYLLNTKIDAVPFGEFLYRLADTDILASWISSHPNSKERSQYIIKSAQDRDLANGKYLFSESWSDMKFEINSLITL